MNLLPANLPSVGNARLPEVYANAKSALEACVKLDECQTWADKAEAMASYARQANDDAMRKMADRIQGRAIQRCGVLLKEIEPSKGGRPASSDETQDGTVPSSRTQAADDAGLSERQRKTALRVANIPEADFEAAIESDNPPTVTALAEQGTVKKLAVKSAADRAEQTAAAKLAASKPKPAVESTAAAKAKPGDILAADLVDVVDHLERGVMMNMGVATSRMSSDDRIAMMAQLARANGWLNKLAVEVAIAGGANLGKLAPVSLRLEALEFLKAATARIEAELAGRAVATPGTAA